MAGIQLHKMGLLSLLSVAGNPRPAPHVAFHGKCVSLLTMARNQEAILNRMLTHIWQDTLVAQRK